MADGEQFKKPKKEAVAPTFNAILELAPPAQKPLLLGYFTEAAAAKTANEFFGAMDKIADILRMKSDPASETIRLAGRMFDMKLDAATNVLGFAYNRNVDTITIAMGEKRFNCLSGNLIMAKIIEEALKANKNLEGKAEMRVVIGTLASFSGGHIIARAEVGGMPRYYDMANTEENGTVINPTGVSTAKSAGNKIYFLGKTFTVKDIETYSHVQQEIRDWRKLTLKEMQDIDIRLLPIAISMASNKDEIAGLISQLGYKIPKDLYKIKDAETRISLALFMMNANTEKGNKQTAVQYAWVVADTFAPLSFQQLNEMKISHEIRDICRAYRMLNETDETERTSALYRIVLFVGGWRTIDNAEDAIAMAGVMKNAGVVGIEQLSIEAVAINKVLVSYGEYKIVDSEMRALRTRLENDVKGIGLKAGLIMKMPVTARAEIPEQFFYLDMRMFNKIDWDALKFGPMRSFIEPDARLMLQYNEFSRFSGIK